MDEPQSSTRKHQAEQEPQPGPSGVKRQKVTKFICDICSEEFSRDDDLKRHTAVHDIKKFVCDRCGKGYTRSDNLKRHSKNCQQSAGIYAVKEKKRDSAATKLFTCNKCRSRFSRRDNLTRHTKSCQVEERLNNSCSDSEGMDANDVLKAKNVVKGDKVALNTFAVHVITSNKENEGDLLTFLSSSKQIILNKLHATIETTGAIKWYTVAIVQFRRQREWTEKVQGFFRSRTEMSLTFLNLEKELDKAFAKVISSFEMFTSRGSDWIIDKVIRLNLKAARYEPLAGCGYLQLPDYVRKRQAVVNVQNTDNKCFMWSILAALHPQKKNPHRCSHYKDFVSELVMTGMTFPVTIDQIDRFEKQNNISVNVFGYAGQILPIRITVQKFSKHVNLLYFENKGTRHYALIKSMSRLLSPLTKHKCKSFYCPYCLHRFSSDDLLQKHQFECQQHSPQKITLPSGKKKWLQFTKMQYQLKVPFVIYSDIECILEKLDTCKPDPCSSYATVNAQHEPSGFCYVIVGHDGKMLKEPVTYRGPDCMYKFLQMLLEEEKYIQKRLKENVPIVMDEDAQKSYDEARDCAACGKPLAGDKVKHHDHLTGKFIAALHENCNLKLKFSKHIPVIIHNMREYDSHLIMQAVSKFKDKRISVIANNMEKYISFSVANLRFIDSFQFIPASLETHVSNMPREEFHLMREVFPNDKLSLLLRKGVYPYEYMDKFSRFGETCLPPQDAFFNSLADEELPDSDYIHAKKVWNEFTINNLGEYHDLYVKCDTVLLADVFESFRKLCMEYYKLDPCHMYTGPGLAWAACLCMTNVCLELLTDIDMYLMFEKGIRGGVAMISLRYSKANSRYSEGYEPGEPTKEIIYWDANNLYGYAMCQPLPCSDFRWLSKEEIQGINFAEIPHDSPKGYVLEVGLEYCNELHDLHSDYPLAPESIDITEEMFSPFMKSIGVGQTKSRKLVPNLRDKESYVLHYRNLQLYLELGLKVKYISRVIEFSQKPWLKPYIDFNTSHRRQAKNDFDKSFFKLMNNAVFGKTMENLRKHVNVRLVHEEKTAKKLVASVAFEAYKIFDSDLVAVKLKKLNLTLNRPIYVGFTVLDVSKIRMYEFHYRYVKKKFGKRAKLLFTDTDSLAYEIETDNLHEDLLPDLDEFDTSNYPSDHPLYNEKNKACLGKMKDETAGIPILEFVGLRAKMYSFLTPNFEKKTAKGVYKSTIRKHLKHKDYKEVLFGNFSQRHDMIKITNQKHQLHTSTVRKTTLCPLDDKRYILDDGSSTLAYGHWRIKM